MIDREDDDDDEGCEGAGPLGLTDWEMELWTEQLKALSAKPSFGYATKAELAAVPLHGAAAWWRNYLAFETFGRPSDPRRN